MVEPVETQIPQEIRSREHARSSDEVELHLQSRALDDLSERLTLALTAGLSEYVERRPSHEAADGRCEGQSLGL